MECLFPSHQLPFFGRYTELAALLHVLTDPTCRLLSLIGPGGIGKTRLAREVATKLQDDFAGGVAWIDLQAVRTRDECIATIAAALALPLTGQSDPWTQMINHISNMHVLLILDGIEHLLESRRILAELLAAAPHTTLLVTSREVLNVQEEWRYLLEGLEVPPKDQDATHTDIEHYSAVQLFVERAWRVRRNFALDVEGDAVIRICHLVGGMPLALELAAAWTATLSCDAIATEIASNMSFLTSRMQNIPERHRSMRATFDQSWNRLSEGERHVFKRLAVFRSGFTITAAELVTTELGNVQIVEGSPGCQTADHSAHGSLYHILAGLIDKSLVRVNPDGRYQIHELLRQFAEAHLCESPTEADWAYAQHTRFVLKLVERAEQALRGSDQHAWLDQLTIEHDNIRAVLRRAQIRGDHKTVLRIGGALWRFWWIRGHMREGRMWLDQALDQYTASGRYCPIRVKALNGAGNLACVQGDYATAIVWHEECLALRRASGDPQGIAVSLHNLGLVARDQGQYARARTHFEESLVIKRALGDRRGVAASLDDLGSVFQHLGDFVAAQSLHEESLAIKRTLGDQQAVVAVLINLGLLAERQGDVVAARMYYQQALTIGREIDDRQDVAEILGYLGSMYVRQGEYATAGQLLRQSVTAYRVLGNQAEILRPLEGLACVVGALGYAERGAQLLGAITALRMLQGVVRSPADEVSLTPIIGAIRAQMDIQCWTAAWTVGQMLSLEQAIQIALADPPPLLAATESAAASIPQHNSPVSATLIEPLTGRELDVLRLIADGLSNQEIATQLVIAEGTVKWHTTQIYSKLGVERRTQAIACARTMQLLP